jgi:hypothetical protein
MLKRLSITVALLTAVLVGVQVGSRPTVAVAVSAACPDTECEMGTLCVSNPGGGTYCDGGENGAPCKTRACVPE